MKAPTAFIKFKLAGIAGIMLAACIATACSGSSEKGWTVEITSPENQQIAMRSFSPTMPAADVIEPAYNANKHIYRFVGNNAEPIYLSLSGLSAPLYLLSENGERISFSIEGDSITHFKGNVANELFIEVQKRITSADEPKRASIIEEFVAANKNSEASTALMALYYPLSRANYNKADSLYLTIAPEARPASLGAGFAAEVAAIREAAEAALPSFSMYGIDAARSESFVASNNSYSAVLFVGQSDMNSRSIAVDKALEHADTAMLAKLRKARSSRRLCVSLEGDSAQWRRAAKTLPDSSKRGITFGHLPGGAGNPQIKAAAVMRLPWIVVVDSTGQVVLSAPAE